MWMPTTGPSARLTSFTKPAVFRIWLLPLPPRLYEYVRTLSAPYCSLARDSVRPIDAISGSL
jgi:hypothetical protein